MKNEISKRVLSLMKERRVSAYRLCKECKIPPSSFSQIKDDKFEFRINHLKSIAKYFNVSLDWLINGEKVNVTVNKNLEKQLYEYKEENELLKEELKEYDVLKKAIKKIKS